MKNLRFVLLGALLGVFIVLLPGCEKKTNAQVSPPAVGGGQADEAIVWLTDWEKAKQTAAAQNKDLLIDFSGSGLVRLVQKAGRGSV